MTDSFKPLRDAVAAGRPGKVQELLSKMTPETAKDVVNQKDSDAFTLLHRACASEQIEIMALLLQYGANPNAPDSCGDSPLHWACFSGNLDAVNVLLECPGDKANPLFHSHDGKTPLDAALEERHTHILQRLFEVPQVFEKRAVLESVLLRGPLALKESGALIPDRVTRYRVWKTHQVILSSMVRAIFICKTRVMAETWTDVEHFNFQDILAVRWVRETRKRYLGRRINVYIRVPRGTRLRIVQEASGIDRADEADALVKDSASGARELERVEHGSDAGEDKVGRLHALRELLGRRGSKKKSPEQSSFKKSSPSASKRSPSGGKTALAEERTICVAFLADSKAEGARWYESLVKAGVMGKSLLAVRIQTCWRSYAARTRLARMKKDLDKGSKLVVRRGTSEDARFVPLDAAYTKPPPRPLKRDSADSATSTALAKFVGRNRVLNAALQRVLPNKKPAVPPVDTTTGSTTGLRSKAKSSTSVAMPLQHVFHNAEDESGWLLKRGKGVMGRWKRRFAILSHKSAELQYYNPARQERVHRVPFSTMLAVKRADKRGWGGKGLCLTVSSAYIDPQSKPETRRKALRRFEANIFFLAQDEKDRDRWVRALESVLPRENVAALKIQKVARGFLARLMIRKLKRIARMKQARRREEALHRIEEARQRAAAESEARAAHEELAVLTRAQQEEREHRRRARAAKRSQTKQGGAELGAWKEFREKGGGGRGGGKGQTDPSKQVCVVQTKLTVKTKTQTGRPYYYNPVTKETAWARPDAAEEDEWTAFTDKASGKTYYVNARTNESRWDLPQSLKRAPSVQSMVSLKTDQVAQQVDKALEAKPQKRKRREDEAQDDDVWQQFTDPNSGAAFFVNQNTGQKAWTRPGDKPAGVDDAKSAWVAFVDPQGRTYYNNPVTGQVRDWRRPRLTSQSRCAKPLLLLQTDPRTGGSLENSPELTLQTVWTLPPGHRLQSSAADDDEEEKEDQLVAHARELFAGAPVGDLLALFAQVMPGIIEPGCCTGAEERLAVLRGALASVGVRPGRDEEELEWDILSLDLRNRVSALPELASLLQDEEDLAELQRLPLKRKVERWLRRQMDEMLPDLSRLLGDDFCTAPSAAPMLLGLGCALFVADSSQPVLPEIKQVAHGKLALDKLNTAELAKKLAKAFARLKVGLYAQSSACLVSRDARLRLGCCAMVMAKLPGLPTPGRDAGEAEEDSEWRVALAWLCGFDQLPRKVEVRWGERLRRRLTLQDLTSDLKDGLVLVALVRALGAEIEGFEPHPASAKQRQANVGLALESARAQLGVDVKLSPLDVENGNRDLVVEFVWALMRHWALAGVESEGHLLSVCNDKVRLLANVRSFRQGANTPTVKFSPAVVVASTDAPVSALRRAVSEDEYSSPKRSSLKRSSLRSSGGTNAEPPAEIASFKDGSLRTAVWICNLLDAVKPGSVNWKMITPANSIDISTSKGLEACQSNATIALSVAMRVGANVCLTWRDIVEVNSKAILILAAAILKVES